MPSNILQQFESGSSLQLCCVYALFMHLCCHGDLHSISRWVWWPKVWHKALVALQTIPDTVCSLLYSKAFATCCTAGHVIAPVCTCASVYMHVQAHEQVAEPLFAKEECGLAQCALLALWDGQLFKRDAAWHSVCLLPWYSFLGLLIVWVWLLLQHPCGMCSIVQIYLVVPSTCHLECTRRA